VTRRRSDFIPEELYKRILEFIPVPCVDIVIVHRDKFLLGRRKNKPAQGKWWFVGGRIRKGERLIRAVLRHVKTETGIAGGRVRKILGAQETIFRNSAHGPSSHTVNIVYLVKVPRDEIIVPANSENSHFRWFSAIEKHWSPYVKDMLRAAGFK
jgi:ADP-ribose pyrophosphatase YjhB (NUDIX family)